MCRVLGLAVSEVSAVRVSVKFLTLWQPGNRSSTLGFGFRVGFWVLGSGFRA